MPRSAIRAGRSAAIAAVLLGLLTPPGALASAPSCQASTLNSSASLAAGAVTVSPTPNTLDASYRTQISFVGVPATAISAVSVTGSRSGSHSGRLAAYSQGDGASFLPSKPFTQGERVTVSANIAQGTATTPVSWRFTVAAVDTTSRSLETPPPPPPPPNASEFQHFISRPDLEPPLVTITTNGVTHAPGDLFLAPYAGPGQYGPMILEPGGGLVWFDRLPAGARAADLRVQEYEGKPVLTWWQDPISAGGHAGSGVVIAGANYLPVEVVRAGNGFEPDLHAFEITPRETALFTIYDAIRCNLSAYGGPAEGAVADTVFQEVDLRTGLVRFEWHALDHVPLADSYMPATPGSPRSPWDYFHINAVSQHGSYLLVDSRNTWAAYAVDAHSGRVIWRLGGKQSSFAMGPGASPAWQHDVRLDPNGTISFFDNGTTPRIHSQSRVIVLALNTTNMSASLVSSFTHVRPLQAASQGDFQPQADGDWMVGWGQEPYFSEFSPSGTLLLDGHLPPAYQSYTVLKFPTWAGAPARAPQLAVRPASHGRLSVYASWNGATNVASWRVLGGTSSHGLLALGAAARSGFETRALISTRPAYVQVEALGAGGEVLGTSALARG